MQINDLLALRPKDETAASIAAAIEAATARVAEIEAELNGAEARRGALIVGGSREDVAANERVISEAETSLKQLAAFIEALGPQQQEAARREQIAALMAEFEQIGAEASVNEFVRRWRTEYAPAARVIADLCRAEARALSKIDAANRVAKRLAVFNVNVPRADTPAVAAVGGVLAGFSTLGDMVRLPGVLGAPHIPLDMTPKRVTERVVRPDWDASGPKDKTGKPLTTKWVEETRDIPQAVPVRSDKPFWWPPAFTMHAESIGADSAAALPCPAIAHTEN